MIKKLLFAFFFAAGFAHYANGQACTPGNFTGHGIHPDSATGFVPGYANQPYTQLITVVVPQDTTPPFPPIPISWDSTVLINIQGLPNGFTYACWNTSAPNARCRWKGNTTGCAIITGNPTIADTGTYHLTVHTNNYLGGSSSPIAYTINYYKIRINGPLGLVNLDPNKFMVGDCSPNPFTNKTEIKFNAPDQKLLTIKVYNMVGVEVYSTTYRPVRGINQFDFERNTLPSGIYVYAISNGEQTISKRMVISN
jgi:hypothetical protein